MNAPVVINATNIGRYPDGIGVYVLNLLRELTQLETDLRFIVYCNRASAPHVRPIRFPGNCELRWVTAALSPDHGFPGHLLRLLYSQLLGLRHRRSTIFITGQLEAVLWRRNQIITVHDIIPLLFPRLHRKQYLYFRYLLAHVVHRAHWIITPSYHTRDLLIRHYGVPGSAVRVIHHGAREYPPAQSAHGDDAGAGEFILFSGRIAPMKNLAALLEAFARLKGRIPHRLIVTGYCRGGALSASPDLRRVQSLLDPGRVEYRGYVSDEELGRLLRGASLLAFPSLYEGFGLPPLEGMAHGCPVLVSNVSSLREVCGDAACYVDPTDVASIADGVYRVLTDEGIRRELSARGRARARRFRWSESAMDHLRLFHHAVRSMNAAQGTSAHWMFRGRLAVSGHLRSGSGSEAPR